MISYFFCISLKFIYISLENSLEKQTVVLVSTGLRFRSNSLHGLKDMNVFERPLGILLFGMFKMKCIYRYLYAFFLRL